MGEIIAPMQSMEYETTPQGPQAAICCGVILYGTVRTNFGDKKKIRLLFELHGDEKMKDGRPFTVSKDFTFSSNEKSSLRQFIEGWRGKKYTTPELRELGGLPISKLIGQSAIVSITHTPNDDGGVWVNIGTISRLMKGMPEPQIVNEKIIYNVDNHDEVEFQKLGKKLQERIQSTNEWRIRVGQIPDPKHQQQPETSIPSDWDSSIPF